MCHVSSPSHSSALTNNCSRSNRKSSSRLSSISTSMSLSCTKLVFAKHFFLHPQLKWCLGASCRYSGRPEWRSSPIMQSVPWTLKSVVCHRGRSTQAGHYYAYTRYSKHDSPSAVWLRLDDESLPCITQVCAYPACLLAFLFSSRLLTLKWEGVVCDAHC